MIATMILARRLFCKWRRNLSGIQSGGHGSTTRRTETLPYSLFCWMKHCFTFNHQNHVTQVGHIGSSAVPMNCLFIHCRWPFRGYAKIQTQIVHSPIIFSGEHCMGGINQVGHKYCRFWIGDGISAPPPSAHRVKYTKNTFYSVRWYIIEIYQTIDKQQSNSVVADWHIWKSFGYEFGSIFFCFNDNCP